MARLLAFFARDDASYCADINLLINTSVTASNDQCLLQTATL